MQKLITISYMHIHCRYIDENTRLSNSYKQYHNKMPQYLFNRPRHIVQHCLEKIDLAKSIPAHHFVNKGQVQFKVHSQTVVNMWYHVSFGGNNEPPLCTCKEWESSHLPCKHMFAVFRHNPDWGFEKLPDTYRNSPFFFTGWRNHLSCDQRRHSWATCRYRASRCAQSSKHLWERKCFNLGKSKEQQHSGSTVQRSPKPGEVSFLY